MGASLEESAPCFIQECAGTLSASKSAWYSPPETAAALPVQGLTPPPPPGLTRWYGHILGVMTGLRSDVGNLLRAMDAQTMLLSGLIKDNNSSSKVVWPQPNYLPRPLPHIVMCGDFNFPHIKWPEGIVFGGTSEEQVQARSLMELSDREFLSQQIRQPTRQNNILDLFFTNNPASINLHRAENNIFSYHNLITINTTYKRKSTLRYEGNSSAGSSPFKAYNFYTEYIKWEGVQHSISEMDWEQVLAGENPNIMLEVLTSKLLEVCSAHVPVKKRLTNGSVVRDPGTMSQLLLHQYNQVFSVPRQDKIVRWQTTFFNEAAPQEHAQLTNITISLEAMERAIREIKPNAAAVPAILANHILLTADNSGQWVEGSSKRFAFLPSPVSRAFSLHFAHCCLAPYAACLVDRPFYMLYESCACRWNAIIRPLLSSKQVQSCLINFVHCAVLVIHGDDQHVKDIVVCIFHDWWILT
ncbi:hypothetical protein Pmani_018786 [Petrolisthes manimaculis]|uniref:Endonuclease/exonuclease/phosphatase domain-containing protein n=1 Tax=Petrolisthes manimaculis TaxID=1843537 RepID=A0AAE1U8E7_9EUCA|nr:hypothetical protein Pmani_018786 [Petrolisthes manimaculis]